jgi:predicted nucleotidyltransferase
MQLSKDLREFVELLNSRKIKYLLVGGHAVAFHGHPRYTGDVDFLIDTSPENAALMAEVIREFGFATLDLTEADFRAPEMVIQLGRPPNRIDILTSIAAVSFEEAWKTRVETRLDGLPVWVISKDFLVQNKLAAARPQDLADVAKLREMN